MRAVLRRVGAALFIGAAFYFLGRALVDQREQLAAFDWSVEPIGLAASLVALVAVLAGGVAIWASVLRHLGHRVRFLDLLRIWFLSSLGRYIPGKIWQFVGVAEMSRASGIPALVGITSLMAYMALAAAAAALVGVYLLPAAAFGALGDVVPWLRASAPLLLLSVHPKFFNAALGVVSRLTRRPLGEWTAGWLDGVVLVGMCALMWLGFGVAFQLFIGSVAETKALQFPALTATYALSFLAGYAAVIAPAGLGAKDGAMAVLLVAALDVPLGVAAALALAARVWSVAGDVLPALILLRARREARAESNTVTLT